MAKEAKVMRGELRVGLTLICNVINTTHVQESDMGVIRSFKTAV